MSGFTKGPWVVQGSEVWATHGIRFNLTTVGTPLIARVCEHKDAEGGFPYEANARLIASSPGLHEALVKAEELLSFHEGSAKPEFDGAHPTVRINGEDFAILLADIRAALSKAAWEGV